MSKFACALSVCLSISITAGLAQRRDALSAADGLRDAAGGAVTIRMHRATAVAASVRMPSGALPLEGSDPRTKALSFLSRHGRLFGVDAAGAELVPTGTREDTLGGTHLSFAQHHRGLPVVAGELRMHFDAHGELTFVHGSLIPAIELETRPTQSADLAVKRALEWLRAERAADLSPESALESVRLVVFRSGLLQRIAGRNHLAWEVRLGNGADVRERVFVDAHHGKVLDSFTGIHPLVDRRIWEGQLNDLLLWQEGDAVPFGDAQVDGLIEVSAETYDLFSHLSGGAFLSWDGADATMETVWLTNSLPCPNASWNGASTNFCDGVASDDIVAHEWGHAYTERTHGLIYQWQPGALNESYSDIFGEIVDVLNGSGNDSPASPRTPGGCSTFGGAPPPALQVTSPPQIAGDYFAAGASFNPPGAAFVAGTLELVNDGSGTTSDGCEPIVGLTSGAVAVLDRGGCSFASKVKRAQDAGAGAAVVVNSGDSAFNMSGNDPSITIPSVMISSSDGDTIKAELGGGVSGSVSLQLSTDVSYRWLNGEDSTGFGGAIRDLWNPTCFGDAGKVSDGHYLCGTGDSGGVHSNSGVPNHGFALLTDGGVYNGQFVVGIGMTKSASLYWRAMSLYQLPDSGFPEHAEALAQSCLDLIGVELPSLVDGLPSGESLTAFDCGQLDKMIQAVEFHSDPPCDFQPLLAKQPPFFECGALVFSDDFESDPAARWTLSNAGVFAEYEPRDWLWTDQLPEGGSGSAFFGIDSLSIGDCQEGSDDQSGVMFLESPPIEIGDEASLAFEHWVATEPAFDGGNVKLSVNGSPYQLIPGSAFLYNAYNDSLVTSENNNTNPLAGEQAFTGTDGGEVGGSWGQSQIDLTDLAEPGDTIRLRFELGVDGCNGNEGWYIDDLVVCTQEAGAGAISVSDATSLLAERDGAQVTLSWGASCVASDSDYAIYEGTLGQFDTHLPAVCSSGGELTRTLTPAAGDRYFLVVPRNAEREGSYGVDSVGSPRASSASACLPQALAPACD